MTATAVQSTNNKVVAIHGSKQDIVNYLDRYKIPGQNVIGMFWDATNNEIICVFKLA